MQNRKKLFGLLSLFAVVLYVCFFTTLKDGQIFFAHFQKSSSETNGFDFNTVQDENSDSLDEPDMTGGSLILDEPDMTEGSLILDTPGCQIPKFDPYDSSLKKIIAPPSELKCPGKPLFLYTEPNAVVKVNETILLKHYQMTSKKLNCYYKPIIRMPEAAGETLEDFFAKGNSRKLHFGIPLNEDFIEVSCKLNTGTFTHFIPLAPLKPEVEKIRNSLERNSSDHLNVILLAIDSVSALNFHRQFLKTRSLFEKKLSAFKLGGYTKVADNTFPNLVPLFTGHFVEYYWNETLYHTKFFDDLDFIWKAYADNGYRTFFAEDMPMFGTFNYGKRGFRIPPTDYYFRPMAMAYYDYDAYKNGKLNCINSQIDVDIILSYLRDFVKTMDSRPFFTFSIISSLTHNYLNYMGQADLPVFRLLNEFWETGVLNKTLLVLFGDHGLRFGPIRQTYIGKYEERMPIIYLSFPSWFLEKYPREAKYLQRNQNRLTTHFDVHATLLHLLKVLKLPHKQTEDEKTAHGLSLMDEIPNNRTCEDANILPHWCPCQIFKNISTSDKMSLACAGAILDKMNHKLKPFSSSCAVLKLGKILDSRHRQVDDVVLKFVQHEKIVINREVKLGKKVEDMRDYLITLSVEPSGGVFESTVRHRIEKNKFEVMDISRINAYGNQSSCIQSSEMRKFCYCKS